MGVRIGALLVALLLVACGPSVVGGTSEVTPPVITIGVAPPKAALQVGKSAQFSATVTGSSDKAVIWSVREAGGGSVTGEGLYSAPSSAGVFHLAAASHADPKQIAEAEITVTTGAPAISVSIEPARVTLVAGATARFRATITGSADGAVTWSAPDGGTVDSAGLFTAPKAAGTFRVVAAAHADPGKTATATVEVSLQSAIAVSISPAAFTVQRGGAQALAATVTGTDDSLVTWSLQETGGGTVNAAGIYVAPQIAGTFHIVATSHADPTRTAVAVATVVAAPRSIAISPQTARVAPGGNVQFQATVSGMTDGRVQYSADAGTVDRATGFWTAPPSEGTFHVTAQSVADPSLQAVAVITVARSTTVTVKIRSNSIFLGPGDVTSIEVDVTGAADRSVTWSIRESPAGGAIDQSVSPARYSAPVAEGVFHVVATSNADPTASDVATITVSLNLRDGGGPVAAAIHAYAIWWGNPTSFPSDEKDAVESFLGTIGGSSYLAIADQYLRGAKATVSFTSSLVDTSTPPDGAAGSSELNQEVCGQIAAQGQKPDPLGMYFVFTPSVPPGLNVCAFHSWTTCDDTKVLYAFMPSPTNYVFCNSLQSLGCNTHSSLAQSVVNYVAHELMEAITDPFGNAWTGPGNEIGDKCNAVFDHCVSLAGAKWQIQEQWSNAAHACVQE